MAYGAKLRVWGERACFTRPEMKVERVSYDVMTPSAARGILEAVHWKPAIRWVIDRIHVLKPIRFQSFRRNEVGAKISADKARSAMKAGSTAGLGLVVEDNRQQHFVVRQRLPPFWLRVQSRQRSGNCSGSARYRQPRGRFRCCGRAGDRRTDGRRRRAGQSRSVAQPQLRPAGPRRPGIPGGWRGGIQLYPHKPLEPRGAPIAEADLT